MKTLRRSIFLLLVFAVLGSVVLEISAEEYVVREGKITLPSTIIRGRYDEIIAKQEIVRMEFVREVEDSPYEVEDVVFHTTEDGFVDYIFPKFSDRFKTTQSQYRILAFVRGDKEMAVYETLGYTALITSVLRNEEALIKAHVHSMTIGGRKLPVLIVVKTMSLLIST